MSFLDDFFDSIEDKAGDFDDGLHRPPKAKDEDDDLLSSIISPTSTRPSGPGLIPLTPTELLTSETSTTSLTSPTTTSSPSLTLATTSTTSVPTTTRSVVSSIPTPTYYTTLEPEIVTNIVTATISKPTPTPSQNSASAGSKSTDSSGPSPVAIGVTVTIAVLSAIAGIIFFVRRRYINRRKNRRQTWNAPVAPAPGKDEEAGYNKNQEEDRFDDIDINEKQSAVPLPDNFTLQNTAGYGAYAAYPSYHQTSVAVGQTFPPAGLPAPPPPLHPTGLAPARAPSPPPIVTGRAPGTGAPAPLGLDMSTPVLQMSNNVVPVAPFSAVSSPHPSMTVPSLTAVLPGTPVSGALLTVTRTFTPSLADELSVQIGEQVRVIEKYDDGWARCERMKAGMGAESGFVPVECLAPASTTESVPGMGMMQEKVDNWRLSHRQSSLNPAAGRY